MTPHPAPPARRPTVFDLSPFDRDRREAGAATVFVVSFAVVLLVLAGLVVDGGLALNARQRVADDVEQAARAGSQNLDIGEIRDGGVVRINPYAARAAATRFLVNRGYPSSGIRVDATDLNDPHNLTSFSAQRNDNGSLLLNSTGGITVKAHEGKDIIVEAHARNRDEDDDDRPGPKRLTIASTGLDRMTARSST